MEETTVLKMSGMNNFKAEVMQLYLEGYSSGDVARKLCRRYDVDITKEKQFKRFKKRVEMCIYRNKNKVLRALEKLTDDTGISFSEEDLKSMALPTEKRLMIRNEEPSTYDRVWDGTEEIKFALVGDTHFGSKYTQFQHLNNFYDICVAEGVRDVYHVGDLTDGLKMRPGHEYDLYVTSADDMIDDVVEHYPSRKGIVTHYITGNHDASIYKHVGYDIGRAINQRRDDMDYLGRDCAVINLTDHCTLELRHPWDGTAYSLSYKPQKMIEAMESDSKPNILAIGHYHKAEYLFYRNVHSFQTGCFQGQTPFTRGKGISVHLGGWIITLKVLENGHIKSITPQFIPYYKSISEDYKNR